MFPLGCAIPNHTVSYTFDSILSGCKLTQKVLQHGYVIVKYLDPLTRDSMYFPPGTMVRSCTPDNLINSDNR